MELREMTPAEQKCKMKYEVTVQAISQGHVTVEADSPEKAETAAMSKLFTGAIHWESTRMEFPGVEGKEA